MKEIAFMASLACGIGLMVSPAWADSNVTIQVQNQFGAPISYQGSNCTSATCPSSFPTPIANGATSPGFTATAFASSGQARCEVVTGQVIQDPTTCNLNATFRMLPK